MEKLTSRATQVIQRMQDQGKVNILTFKQTASIDHQLATGLKKIKSDFEVKEKNSRAYVAKIESSTYYK